MLLKPKKMALVDRKFIGFFLIFDTGAIGVPKSIR